MHWGTGTVDDECYDMEVKMTENENEVLVFVMEMNRSLASISFFTFESNYASLYPKYQVTHQLFQDQMQCSHTASPSMIISIYICSHTKGKLWSHTYWLNSSGIPKIGVKTCASRQAAFYNTFWYILIQKGNRGRECILKT